MRNPDLVDRVGGGVAIWCKHHLQPEDVHVADKQQGVEMVAVKIRHKMIIIGTYIPPRAVLSNQDAIIQYVIDLTREASSGVPHCAIDVTLISVPVFKHSSNTHVLKVHENVAVCCSPSVRAQAED